MATARTNGRRRPPGPSRTIQFTPMQPAWVLGGDPMTLTICHSCAAVVLSGDKPQARHTEFHMTIEAGLPR